MDTIEMLMEWQQLQQVVTDYVNGRLREAGRDLEVEPGSLDNPIEGQLTLRLVPKAPPVVLTPPKPRSRTLDDLLEGSPQAVERDYHHDSEERYQDKRERERAADWEHNHRFEALEDAEPPPLVDPSDRLVAALASGLAGDAAPLGPRKLYGAPPEVDEDARRAFRKLQEAGLVAPHLTPELLASQTRDDVRDGVGEKLGNGYVVGSTPPAGHEDDPHQRAPWRRKSPSVADMITGSVRQEVS